jgi:putative sterol carrier protein
MRKMISPQRITVLVKELSDASKEQSKKLISNYFQTLAEVMSSVDEMRENFADYNDIYQIAIDDIELEGWFQIKHGTITYQEGKNEDYDLKFRMSKDLLLEIIPLETMPFDAYMKGRIKVKGEISYTIRFRNFINDVIEYISKD